MHPHDNPACFAHHMGLWAMEPVRFQHLVALVQAGLWQEHTVAFHDDMPGTPRAQDQREGFTRTPEQVALIRISGPMSKGRSKFTDASTIDIRRAVRNAARDEQVASLMLAIDSPGGMVAGTAELADEIRSARARKPVVAYIEDLGASAAYWVASQADAIYSNRTAEIGSIGVLAVVNDTSGLAERSGVKVHVISTGPYKGAGVPGAPLLPEHLSDMAERVGTVADHFFGAVQAGRKLTKSQMATVTDGRVFDAQRAQELGLTDGVKTFDEAFAEAAYRQPKRRRGPQRAEREAARAFWKG